MSEDTATDGIMDLLYEVAADAAVTAADRDDAAALVAEAERRARRQCAEELRAATRVARLRHRNGRTAGMMLAPFEFLAEEWLKSDEVPS